MSAHEPGAKLDQGKVLIVRGALHQFPLALEAVARVSEYGARKYCWGGWLKVPDGFHRYTEALGRHLQSEAFGERDEESEMLHAEQAAWNALARLELLLRSRLPG